MIYTSYFANIKNLPDNVVPISIARKTPEWYEGLTYTKLAPTYDLLYAQIKGFVSRGCYSNRFYEETLDKLDQYSVVMQLKHLCETSVRRDIDICLVCYESPEKFCHRHLVAEWLNAGGFECEEWRKE